MKFIIGSLSLLSTLWTFSTDVKNGFLLISRRSPLEMFLAASAGAFGSMISTQTGKACASVNLFILTMASVLMTIPFMNLS